MRKVKFKQFINNKTTGFDFDGMFHQWGNSYEEFESGPGNLTTAIIEMGDGSIKEVLPTHLIFIDAIVLEKDGNNWCAHYKDFINLQESVSGFGDTQDEAINQLINNPF